MRYIGVDLHKNNFMVCYLYSDSNRKRFEKYDLVQIDQFCKKLKKSDVMAVEATTNTRFFIGKVEPFIEEIKAINTFQFKVISSSVKKTDKNDAEAIFLFEPFSSKAFTGSTNKR